jgi:hypothetical protein
MALPDALVPHEDPELDRISSGDPGKGDVPGDQYAAYLGNDVL